MIIISKYCKKVTGVEINKSAIVNAKKNADINDISNIEFICKDSSKAVLELEKIYNDRNTAQEIYEEIQFCKMMHELRPQQWELDFRLKK